MAKTAPWNEVVGTVEDVGDDSVTLLCTRKVTLRIRAEDLRKILHLLRLGALVGVLVLEDGSVRVRVVAKGASKTHRKR